MFMEMMHKIDDGWLAWCRKKTSSNSHMEVLVEVLVEVLIQVLIQVLYIEVYIEQTVD